MFTVWYLRKHYDSFSHLQYVKVKSARLYRDFEFLKARSFLTTSRPKRFLGFIYNFPNNLTKDIHFKRIKLFSMKQFKHFYY